MTEWKKLRKSCLACRLVAGLCLAVALTMPVMWHFGLSVSATKTIADGQSSWILVSAVIFIAACISSTVGFAFSAIVAAALLYVVPDHIRAIQIMLAASIGIQAYSVASLWQAVSWRTCAPFVGGGVAAIPVGVYLLMTIDPRHYVLAMGLALIVYGSYMLFKSDRPKPIAVENPTIDVVIGALGGLVGALTASPGALVVIRCSKRGWSKVAQRCVYQPYILVMQIVTYGSLSAYRGHTVFDIELSLYAIPGVAGAFVGLKVFQALSDRQFQALVNLALIASGLALAMK